MLGDWRHAVRHKHWPEWYALGGLRACLRCTKGGNRSRNLFWKANLSFVARPLT